MKAHIYVTGILCMGAVAPLAMAQSTPSPLTEAGISNTCDQFKLSFQDLADCRTQWGAATTESDRQRVRSTFAARGGARGSSTPPGNQTVLPGAGLSTGGNVGAIGATPSAPPPITQTSPTSSLSGSSGTLSSPAPTPAPTPTPAPSPSSTAIPPAPSPAIRTAPPPVSSTPAGVQ